MNESPTSLKLTYFPICVRERNRNQKFLLSKPISPRLSQTELKTFFVLQIAETMPLCLLKSKTVYIEFR